MHFTKWNGCGNDFILINALTIKDINPIVNECVHLCDRHFGIGADGIIFVLPSLQADLKMKIFNADGTEAEMCGNGIRCFAQWVFELGLVKQKKFSVETGVGILYPEVLDEGNVRVDMGKPIFETNKIPVIGMKAEQILNANLYVNSLHKSYVITCVSMGNPHCVIFTKDIVNNDRLTLEGASIECDVHFPHKINVEFAKIIDRKTIRMRVWECGTGITLACGTGSCATAVAAILQGIVDNNIDILVDGGILQITWNGGNSHVFMTGPTTKVFEGQFFI